MSSIERPPMPGPYSCGGFREGWRGDATFPRHVALALVLSMLACIAWNVYAGPNWSWDRLQYHIYAPYQLANGLIGRGFAPAGGQTFLNPLPFMPAWLLQRAGMDEFTLSCTLAAFHGLCLFLVWLIARMWFTGMAFTHARAGTLAVVTAVSAFFTPVYLLEVGSSYADVITTIPLLAGVACAIRSRQAPWTGLGWIVAAGVGLGLAAGLKLSNATAALAGIAFVPLWSARTSLARLAAYAGGGIAGGLLGHGWWSVQMWRHYGNPLFPTFPGLFAASQPASDGPAGAALATADAIATFGDRLAGAWSALIGGLQASGTRFTPRQALDWLDFPLRVADPGRQPPAFAYIETFQPDIPGCFCSPSAWSLSLA